MNDDVLESGPNCSGGGCATKPWPSNDVDEIELYVNALTRLLQAQYCSLCPSVIDQQWPDDWLDGVPWDLAVGMPFSRPSLPALYW
jgi:hypothetical protein